MAHALLLLAHEPRRLRRRPALREPPEVPAVALGEVNAVLAHRHPHRRSAAPAVGVVPRRRAVVAPNHVLAARAVRPGHHEVVREAKARAVEKPLELLVHPRRRQLAGAALSLRRVVVNVLGRRVVRLLPPRLRAKRTRALVRALPTPPAVHRLAHFADARLNVVGASPGAGAAGHVGTVKLARPLALHVLAHLAALLPPRLKLLLPLPRALVNVVLRSGARRIVGTAPAVGLFRGIPLLLLCGHVGLGDFALAALHRLRKPRAEAGVPIVLEVGRQIADILHPLALFCRKHPVGHRTDFGANLGCNVRETEHADDRRLRDGIHARQSLHMRAECEFHGALERLAPRVRRRERPSALLAECARRFTNALKGSVQRLARRTGALSNGQRREQRNKRPHSFKHSTQGTRRARRTRPCKRAPMYSALI
eukprot:Opistho-1_new@41337